jgi:hypothetical protein
VPLWRRLNRIGGMGRKLKRRNLETKKGVPKDAFSLGFNAVGAVARFSARVLLGRKWSG